jgi:hypothetical protein
MATPLLQFTPDECLLMEALLTQEATNADRLINDTAWGRAAGALAKVQELRRVISAHPREEITWATTPEFSKSI